MSDLTNTPYLRFLPKVYNSILRTTKKRGMRTLSRFHHSLYRNGQVFQLQTGSKMYLPPDPHFFGYLTQVHEVHVAMAIRNLVKEGSICVDVGANIGFFSLMMADHVGEEGSVFAIEPVPENFKVLSENAQLNNQHTNQITTRNMAVSDRIGKLAIKRGSESTLHMVAEHVESTPQSETIPCTTIDNLCEEQERGVIHFLKIDVEGHEESVLQGATRSLQNKKIRYILIEVTPGEPAKNIQQMLSEFTDNIVIWQKNRWIKSDLSKLTHRTDALVELPFSLYGS